MIGLKNNNEEIRVDYLISDASNAIRNAFENVFGVNKTQIMCWAHMHRNVVKNDLPFHILTIYRLSYSDHLTFYSEHLTFYSDHLLIFIQTIK